MNEVSGRVLALYRNAETLLKLRPGTLFQGMPFASASSDPERIAWVDFCVLNERLEEAAGGSVAMEQLGASLFEVPAFMRLVRIMQLLGGPGALYWASTRWGGPLLFPCLSDTLTETKDAGLTIVTEIPARLRDCPAFLRMNVGFYRALPRLLGLPDSHVAVTITERRAVYRITPPPSLTFWSRIRHSVQAVTSTKSALIELANLNTSLQGQFIKADLAREEAERQRADAVTARDEARRALAEAERARTLAEDALRVKSEFLATISHELRTPLNGVLGMTQLLLETTLDADQLECAETVRLSGESLLTLINDILDYARIDAGQMAMDAVSYDLGLLVEEVMQVIACRAQEKGLELTASVDASLPHVIVGDAERMRQVLLNLVGNAVKFTERGEVRVLVSPVVNPGQEPRLRIAVEDTGIGIAEAARARIFEAFTQADGSMTRRYGGSGLGLTISKRLVELMGGRLGVDSEVGRGSTFTIEVPLLADRGSSPAIIVPVDGRVLVVDGNPHVASMIAERLVGATVEHEPRVGSAVDRMRREAAAGTPYALVLVDTCADPDLGIGLGRAIREDNTLVQSSLGLLAPIASRERATGLEVEHIISKPVRRADLIAALRAAVLVSRSSRPRAHSSGRVLIADDNRINQLVIVRMVRALGYEAATVSDGEEAIRAIERSSFDAVLMDWHMPGVDGVSATRTIRMLAGAKGRIPIIAMTASAFPADRETCLAAGMSDYLAKPVDLSTLRDMLGRWVGSVDSAERSPTSE